MLRRMMSRVISIHALREEGDHPCCPRRWCPRYFYPRPPRGGRRTGSPDTGCPRIFLSTPSARRATMRRHSRCRFVKFLSTPSARRATYQPAGEHQSPDISIHALREEGDLHPVFTLQPHNYFYPRPPRGGRLLWCSDNTGGPPISIHALREEGDGDAWSFCAPIFNISIHALREEGDAAVALSMA